MAKVLFIQGNYDIDNIRQSFPWMPVALVELATFLREKGHEVRILDRNIYPDNKKLVSILKNFNPDIVGMTCYTSPVIKDIKQVSRIAKENSNALVIIGGTHASIEPKSLLDFQYIDYIVRGEGEEVLLEICELIDKKKATKKNILKIKNINYNKTRPFINLNEFPTPDYELLEVKKYPLATFYTTRGCPGRCKFCYNPGFRLYKIENVIELITRVFDKYKIKEFTIADDNFVTIPQRTEKICNVLSKYNAIFHMFSRVDRVNDKILTDLKKGGCWSIQFGFESGSQRILDFINKKTTVQQNINAIKQCRKHKIFVDGSFMMGIPTETVSEMRQTANFIKKYRPDNVEVKIFTPYPSTPLYEYAIKKGLMKKPETLDDWERFSNLKAGPNVSKIPTALLVKTINELSKKSNFIYLKKALLLLANGHLNYALLKTRRAIEAKLGLI